MLEGYKNFRGQGFKPVGYFNKLNLSLKHKLLTRYFKENRKKENL